jgi:AcrR family transcriptional regulator
VVSLTIELSGSVIIFVPTSTLCQVSTVRTSRRGRPRADEVEQHRRHVIDACYQELVERGYQNVTMSQVAARAGASKETLYAWFGNRDGLFRALIIENADASAQRVRDALDTDADPAETLTGYAVGLLTLLTSGRSIALNRAAMTSPELAATLLESGRHRIGPLVERYLGKLAEEHYLDIDDTGDAFTLLYGLIIQDTQIRVLLGENPPTSTEISRRAHTAVERFLRLTRAH